jgi:hypothetical protein
MEEPLGVVQVEEHLPGKCEAKTSLANAQEKKTTGLYS